MRGPQSQMLQEPAHQNGALSTPLTDAPEAWLFRALVLWDSPEQAPCPRKLSFLAVITPSHAGARCPNEAEF